VNSRLLVTCIVLAHVIACVPLNGAEPLFLDVHVSERLFDAPKSYPTIDLRSGAPVRIDLLMYDRNDRIVWHGGSDQVQTEHQLAITNLPRVAYGQYWFCLVASDARGSVIGMHPAEPDGGELVKLRDLTRNGETRTIEYFLPQAGFVRLRVGLREGALLETILPWSAQSAGAHGISWDGTCQNGLFRDLYDHPDLQMTAVAIATPRNVIVDRSRMSVETADPPPAIQLPEPLKVFTWAPWRARTPVLQVGQLNRVENDYRIELEIVTDAQQETAQIRVNCHANDRARLLNRRFEIMLFLDTVFEMEEEDAVLPFTYALPTRNLAPGQHLVTVNIVDVTGRLGTVTRSFQL